LNRHGSGRRAYGSGPLPAAALMLLLLGCSTAADLAPIPPAWPDTFVGRLEALAVLETLNAELLSHDSATLTLEHWCDEHRLAPAARVVATRMNLPDKAPSADQRRELDVSDAEPVRYRRVRLSCGAAVLSEADNWYVPSRLSADMNKQLESTDTPFGKVVQPLHFRRHTLTAQLLWHPLPAGWELAALEEPARIRMPASPPARGLLTIPASVLEHRALLTLPDGTPVSEVVETYSGAVLGFTRQSSPN
jgi:chorismate-pyruvate lyase